MFVLVIIVVASLPSQTMPFLIFHLNVITATSSNAEKIVSNAPFNLSSVGGNKYAVMMIDGDIAQLIDLAPQKIK